MTDPTAPNNNSYVNDYQPPKDDGLAPDQPQSPMTPPPISESATNDGDLITQPPQMPVTPVIDPAPEAAQTPVTTSTFLQATETSEKLADQNIFFLLGVKEDEATADQRESFLDELQQVIWEDFLENDVQLLLTKQESDELKQMTQKTQGKAIEDQEEIVVFLEKLIPDLEEIMLEKALELKADMVKERIAGMKERFASDPEKLKQVELAEQQLTSNQWLSLAKTLNAVQ